MRGVLSDLGARVLTKAVFNLCFMAYTRISYALFTR